MLDHMTIPLEVVLDLPSVDAPICDNGTTVGLDTVWSTVDRKRSDNNYNRDTFPLDPTWQQKFPIHLFIASVDPNPCYYHYEDAFLEKYRGELIMGNGHHRVTHLLDLGRKFVYFSFDFYETGWY